MRILAVCEYDGTSYAGWQYQPNEVSVQETIENAISKIRNTKTQIFGSGRTDAGVHALGQTFHFDIEEERDLEKFRYSINCVLPNDIRIKSLKVVADDFHARLSAKSKTYEYRINLKEKSAFEFNHEEVVDQPLDIKAMEHCSKSFIGKHCFQNFTTKPEDQDGYMREIYEIKFIQADDHLRIRFTGNGFMRYMVRFLVGTLIQVGLGRINEDLVKKILNSEERKVVSYKAEGKGLFLVEVTY